MARGTQFGQLIDMFRDQAGHANSRALGQNELAGIKARLRRVYRFLHADFNWPHLRVQRDKVLQAGERYYDFPSDLDTSSDVTEAWIREANRDVWYPLRHGIGRAQYNTVNSDTGEREDFPVNWDEYEDDMFEVWPVPQTNGHVVRFYGTKRPKPLVQENETVDLDDEMIVLYALGEQLMKQKSAEADMIAQQARARYMRMRANSQHSPPVDMRVNSDRGSSRQGIDIRYAELRDGNA